MSKNVDMNFKISVAITVYKNDKAQYFERALQSITIDQTVKPDEIVLVIDGPVEEEINQVVNRYLDIVENFKVIRLDKNVGLGNALRIAVENSKNEIIARMDSDDIAVPDRFEQQIKIFSENKDLDIVGGDIAEFIEDENEVVTYRKVPIQDSEIKEYMKKRCPFNHVSVMFKKKSVLECGNYQDLFFNEDYFLWIRMAEKSCKMMNTGTTLVNVRISKDTFKRRGGKKYFKSELFLQKYMLRQKSITKSIFIINILKRLIVQILMPNCIRSLVFRIFARERG